MANATTKQQSELSQENVLRNIHNAVDGTISTNGFLVGKVGHKVTAALSTTTLVDDTVTYSFYDGATLLYQIAVVYATTQTASLLSAERTA